jgi:short-subunit dehydrogenase
MNDKVVIITGASSGIGKACAQEFSRMGSKVVLAARDEAALQQVAASLPGEHLLVRTDVSREDDCRSLVEGTVSRFGRIDVLINNAGISMRALFNDTDLSVIKRLMDVNFWGTVYCTKYALPHLLQSKGSVVGISSVAGYIGLPGRTGYSASKSAMHGFLNALRTENMKTGLHVLLACPSFVNTPIRTRALDAQGQMQRESPLDESKLMGADVVAKQVYKAVVKRKRVMVTPLKGKLSVILSRLFPAIIDRQAYKLLGKEPDSPFK